MPPMSTQGRSKAPFDQSTIAGSVVTAYFLPARDRSRRRPDSWPFDGSPLGAAALTVAGRADYQIRSKRGARLPHAGIEAAHVHAIGAQFQAKLYLSAIFHLPLCAIAI